MKRIFKFTNKKHFSLIIIFTIFFCFFLNPFCGFTSAFPNSRKTLTDYGVNKIGQIDTGLGSMFDLFVSGNYVYSATRRAGLVTFDIADLSSPNLVSIFDDPKEISENQLWDSFSALTDGIFVDENVAYLADGHNGLVILDVSSPEQPVKVGHYRDDSIPNILIKNNLAFVRSSKYIKIIDVSNVNLPIFVGKIGFDPYSSERIKDFAISDDYLYLSSIDVLIIFDITDPSNPIEVNRLENYDPLKITVLDDRLFGIVAEQSPIGLKFTISIFNIDNPIAPVFLGECVFEEADTYIQSFVVSDFFVYIATYEKIFAINTTNQNSPELVGSIDVSFHGLSHKKLALQSNNQSLNNGIVFCADYEQGLLIYNFSSPMNPNLISKYDLGQQAKALYTTEDFVYLCTSKEYFSPTHLDIVSIDDPSNPDLLGRYHSNGSIMDVVVHQNLAFLALRSEPTNHCLEIIDVSNPKEPILVGYCNETSSSNSLKIRYDNTRKLVFLANDEEGYSIISVANYTQPNLIYSDRPLGMNVVDIDVKDNLLFIADGRLFGGFSIFNVSNPLSPIKVYTNFLNTMVFDIEFVSNMIYLTTDSSPLVIYDATNIFAPKKISSFTNDLIINYGKLVINDTLAYIAREANGLVVVDTSNPQKTESIIEYRPEYSGLCYDVAIFENYLLIADGWDGFEILELVSPIISKQLLIILSILPSSVGFILTLIIVIKIILNKKKQ